ncbi:MAG TPA: glycoside hydrolase family 15 protein [Nitriliruptorales bacterium]|nr:glycoside hydrolase family 15 protein [Nitriliruptorales bacterium]
MSRKDGYASLGDYAAIGDGRTVALVARDGTIDWLPLPDLDSPAVFAGCLDVEQGGRWELRPDVPFTVQRRYLPDTNVLETTFWASTGIVRVTDAVTLTDGPLAPQREVARRIEGLAGRVPLRWHVEPRFRFGAARGRVERRRGIPVVTSGGDALAVMSFGAGQATCRDGVVSGRTEVATGQRGLLVLAAAHAEPLVLPTRDQVEGRIERTCTAWRRWADGRRYEGPWRDSVSRSVLALRLLVHAPSGAVAAAATTSLPEEIGGMRNWDYRFSWVRDAAFTLEAFLRLGFDSEATAYLWWLMHASQLTHPNLQVLYRLDGGAHAQERTLPLAGYRGSSPVRVGNGAAGQLQLDSYGALLQAVWQYTQAGGRLDRDIARRVARLADHVSEVWSRPDAGIWEVRSDPLHFTQSKMMCWVALDRAARLASGGLIPQGHAARWRREADHIRGFVAEHCFSPRRGCYVRSAGSDEADASLLLGVLYGYDDPMDPRLRATVDAVERELADGPFVHRYRGVDGVAGGEGAFVACSFWLVEALARTGRLVRAAELMDELVAVGNDVGLYSEEIDPATGEFLGNLPQALSHLALISAAGALSRGAER